MKSSKPRAALVLLAVLGLILPVSATITVESVAEEQASSSFDTSPLDQAEESGNAPVDSGYTSASTTRSVVGGILLDDVEYECSEDSLDQTPPSSLPTRFARLQRAGSDESADVLAASIRAPRGPPGV